MKNYDKINNLKQLNAKYGIMNKKACILYHFWHLEQLLNRVDL